jgi:hypothetical protein
MYGLASGFQTIRLCPLQPLTLGQSESFQGPDPKRSASPSCLDDVASNYGLRCRSTPSTPYPWGPFDFGAPTAGAKAYRAGATKRKTQGYINLPSVTHCSTSPFFFNTYVYIYIYQPIYMSLVAADKKYSSSKNSSFLRKRLHRSTV